MTEKCNVQAKEKAEKIKVIDPLIHLVPVPVFSMAEATVDFDMNIEQSAKEKKEDRQVL